MPTKEKPQRANVEVHEPKLSAKQTSAFKRYPNRKSKPTLRDDGKLWGRVAPGAKWRECVTHGKVECPDLSQATYGNGTMHIKASCPDCGCYLGSLPQKREKVTDKATLMQRFMQYRRQAKAAGHRDGAAYFRFVHDFGQKPDPAWTKTDQGGAL